MKIAVCDDSVQMREQVIDQIKNSEIMTENLEIIQFCAGKQILEQYAAGTRFEMVFMDVEMGEPNGIETGLRLREYDDKLIIIFVSNYPKYAVNAYACEAFYYIVKPIETPLFQNVLHKAFGKYRLFHQHYVIISREGTVKIDINNLLYVEKQRRHLIFHTITGEYEVPGKIGTVELELAKYDFYRVHQGYLVNLNHIESILGLDIIMDNGDKVQIPVHKRTEMIKTYTSYVKRVL